MAAAEPQRADAGLLLYHPLDGLLADPGLLDDEVWRLFEVPGAARELAKCKGTWEEALVTLSERGLLDRGRLLDACLDAFFRDFAPTQVGWYATFHDRMAPTLDEVAARAGKYLALLGTNSAHGVTLAQRACDRLLAAGGCRSPILLAASPPLLLFPQKGVAIRQLKLLGKIAREPSLRPLALATAAGAFGHARLDVQEAALDLIGKLGVPDGAEAAVIAGHAAYLAPALASKAAGLGLLSAPPRSQPRGHDCAVGTGGPARDDASSRPAATAAPPLEDPAELIRLLTQLMEDAPTPWPSSVPWRARSGSRPCRNPIASASGLRSSSGPSRSRRRTHPPPACPQRRDRPPRPSLGLRPLPAAGLGHRTDSALHDDPRCTAPWRPAT